MEKLNFPHNIWQINPYATLKKISVLIKQKSKIYYTIFHIIFLFNYLNINKNIYI